MNVMSTAQIQLLSRTLTALLVIALGGQLAWWTWHFITPSLRSAVIAPSIAAGPDMSLGRQLFGDERRDGI